MQYLSPYKMPESVFRSTISVLPARRMELAQKDLGLALQMAHDCGIAMPVTGLVSQLLAKVYGVYDDALR
jgi:3-hydroxyisobutyrate dehydrogenase-like beta-hydroxyacid dehydrogenase